MTTPTDADLWEQAADIVESWDGADGRTLQSLTVVIEAALRAAHAAGKAEGAREERCKRGACECEPPHGIEVEHDGGGLFPQTRGWYWTGSEPFSHGPYDTQHEAVVAAIRARGDADE